MRGIKKFSPENDILLHTLIGVSTPELDESVLRILCWQLSEQSEIASLKAYCLAEFLLAVDLKKSRTKLENSLDSKQYLWSELAGTLLTYTGERRGDLIAKA